jgi:mRNA interferase HigB
MVVFGFFGMQEWGIDPGLAFFFVLVHGRRDLDNLSNRALLPGGSPGIIPAMRVISLKLLRQFWERHSDAEAPLRHWYKSALLAKWKSLQEVRRVYPHADGAAGTDETLTVFNIGGNKYRLVARIRYDYQLINVRAVLTHQEYDAGKWKE